MPIAITGTFTPSGGADAFDIVDWHDVASHKWDATEAPDEDNDTDEGYVVGSLWCDVTNDKAYVCLDITDGAAVWTEITGAGGGGDASDITYTPTVATDWDGDADPGDVNDALDQLAERVDDVEGGAGHAAVTVAADLSPLITLSTQELSFAVQNANKVLAGPTSGGDADPTMRALVAADIPDVSATYVPKSLYDAQSVLAATADNTPTAVTVAQQTVVGRLTGGDIDDIAIGILDDNILQVDHTSTAAVNQYARFTANGLESRSEAEFKGDYNLEDADINALVIAQKLDDHAAPDDNTDLNASTSNHGLVVKATAPAAAQLNVVGLVNGETAYTNKGVFDATVPTTIAESAAAAAGTATTAAHRDHTHGAPATYAATAHAILDGSVHSDSVADGVTAGSLIIGNDTPKWDELVITVPGGANLLNVLGVATGETTPSYKVLFDATAPEAIGTAAAGTGVVAAHRNHVHAHGTPTSHDRPITCAIYLSPVSDTIPKWISPPLPLGTITKAEIKSYTACGAIAQVIDIGLQTAANKGTNTFSTIWATHGNCLTLPLSPAPGTLLVDSSADSTHFVDTALTGANDYVNGLYFFNLTLGLGSVISDFDAATDTVTLASAVADMEANNNYTIGYHQAETTTFDTTAVAEGDRLYVFSHVLGTGLSVAYITVWLRPT